MSNNFVARFHWGSTVPGIIGPIVEIAFDTFEYEFSYPIFLTVARPTIHSCYGTLAFNTGLWGVILRGESDKYLRNAANDCAGGIVLARLDTVEYHRVGTFWSGMDAYYINRLQ